MRVLLLGETKFVGRALRHLALARGDDVVHVKRSAIRKTSGSFDLTFDTGARSAADVRAVTALGDRAGHYVLVSSYAVYLPGARVAPWDEGAIDLTDEPPAVPTDTVGAALRAAERELLLLCGRSLRAWTVLRPAVVEGAHHPAGLTRWLADRLRAGGAIQIPPGDLPTFSLVHASDVARAALAVAGRAQAAGRALNVTSSSLVTVASHARQVANVLRVEAPLYRGSLRSRDDAPPLPPDLERAFLAPSSLLAELGWSAGSTREWLPKLVKRFTEAPAPAAAAALPTPDPDLAPLLPLLPVLPVPSGWAVRLTPSQPASPALERVTPTPGAMANTWRVHAALLLGVDEWLARDVTPSASVIAGHAAIVGPPEGGDARFLLAIGADGAEPGVRSDGWARDLVTASPDALIPVPDALSGTTALLAVPLARLLEVLPASLGTAGLVWIFGHRVEARLAAWLAEDAGIAVESVDRTGLAGGTVEGLASAEGAVVRKRRPAPTVAVNASGAPEGERLLRVCLGRDGLLVSPFSTPAGRKGPVRAIPWLPSRASLEAAVAQLVRWSTVRDLGALATPPVNPTAFHEALLARPFVLGSVGRPEAL